MTYQPNPWQHGDIITATKLNNIENALGTLSQNSYNSEYYDGTVSTTDKIALKSSITTAINGLDSTVNVTDATLDESGTANYRKVLTSITQTNGKIVSTKYINIPTASREQLGLIKIGDNLTAGSGGIISASYATDQTYNGVETIDNAANPDYNPLVTVKGMKIALSNVIEDLSSVAIDANTNYDNQRLTITSINTRNSTDGTVSLTRQPISIPHGQVNDIYITGTADASGANSGKYELPTRGEVLSIVANSAVNTATQTAIETAIGSLDGNLNSTTPGAAKTITAFSQTDGVVSVTFDDIQNASSSVPGLMSAAHYTKLENLDSVPALEEGATDDRINGLITPAERDMLYDIDNTLNDFFIITNGHITGIKVYDANIENYKVLTYDDIDNTGTPVE